MVHENGLGDHYVGRPGPFGNPFKLDFGKIYIDTKHRRQSLEQYIYFCEGDDQLVQDLYRAVVLDDKSRLSVEVIELCHRSIDVRYWIEYFERVDFSILKGKNLYCYCPINAPGGSRFPCHADVLLEIVNKEGDHQ